MDPRDEWRPVAEIARRFRIAPRRLRQAIRGGELEHSKLGRAVILTTERAVDSWLRRQTVPPTPSAEARAAMIAAKLN